MDLEEAKAEFEKYPFYDITEKECQERIDKLDFVCGGCGKKPTPIETVNNNDEPTFWAGCNECGVFENGVPLMVWKTANAMYDKGERSTWYDYNADKPNHLRNISDKVWSVVRVYEEVSKNNN